MLFTSSGLRLIKLVAAMSLFTHWNGCIQFLIASVEQFPVRHRRHGRHTRVTHVTTVALAVTLTVALTIALPLEQEDCWVTVV